MFIDFIGQATTSAFVYKLNNPIIPYNKTNTMESTSVLSAFNNSTKLYEKLEIRFPKPETEIKIHYNGWKFKEKPLTPPMQQVTLIIGFKIQIADQYLTDEKEILEYYDTCRDGTISNLDRRNALRTPGDIGPFYEVRLGGVEYNTDDSAISKLFRELCLIRTKVLYYASNPLVMEAFSFLSGRPKMKCSLKVANSITEAEWKYLTMEIMKTYKEAPCGDRSKLLNYFIQSRLKNLTNEIGEF